MHIIVQCRNHDQSINANGWDNRTNNKHLVRAVVLKSGMSNRGHASSDFLKTKKNLHQNCDVYVILSVIWSQTEQWYLVFLGDQGLLQHIMVDHANYILIKQGGKHGRGLEDSLLLRLGEKKIGEGESRRGKGRDIYIFGEIGGPVRDIPWCFWNFWIKCKAYFDYDRVKVCCGE